MNKPIKLTNAENGIAKGRPIYVMSDQLNKWHDAIPTGADAHYIPTTSLVQLVNGEMFVVEESPSKIATLVTTEGPRLGVAPPPAGH